MVLSGWQENKLEEVEVCPKSLASVKFGDLGLGSVGQIVTPMQVQDAPNLSWEADPHKLYAVFMTDPDAPSRATPTFREWYHWGVVNIKGNDISAGETVAEYVGAGPPQGTGLHRYVVLVYEQPGPVKFHEKLGLAFANRNNRKIRDIAAQYKLGAPVAGACFQAEWDDYVPKLMAKLK